MQLRPRVGRARIPCWEPKLVKLGADLALSAEVPTGPGASFGLPISSARGCPKGRTTSDERGVDDTPGGIASVRRTSAEALGKSSHAGVPEVSGQVPDA